MKYYRVVQVEPTEKQADEGQHMLSAAEPFEWPEEAVEAALGVTVGIKAVEGRE